METYRHYDDGTTVCSIFDEATGLTFTGIAKCNPDDVYDERIGDTLAAGRAQIEALRVNREAIRAAKKDLHTVISCVKQKKDYKAKDYKVIFHLMEDYEDGIRAINAQILCLKNDLSAYMNTRVKSK